VRRPAPPVVLVGHAHHERIGLAHHLERPVILLGLGDRRAQVSRPRRASWVVTFPVADGDRLK
jgi:hypothetical protein